jgi:crotonobetainyl-CoA:carnitine CoA-transferase CaiB-like acyl-CoA transferase
MSLFSSDASQAYETLIGGIGWRQGDPGITSLGFQGELPDVGSTHRLGAAMGAAAAAVATGMARRWTASGQPGQTVSVDATQSLCALNSVAFQRHNGRRIPASSLGREFKSAFYATKDGRWFYPVGSYPHLRDGILTLLDCANNTAAIGRAIAGWRSDELEEAFLTEGLAGVQARTAAEWHAHPQGALLLNTPLIDIESTPDASSRKVATPRERPMDDLKVIDFSHVIAGPVAARTLAEYGASVMRLSSPKQPDPLNQIMDTGLGKKNAYLDLDDTTDVERLHDLIRSADVFVQSWTEGSLARRGFAYDDVRRLNPNIVYLSVTAFGSDGPWSGRKGFDQLGQTATGVAQAEAGPDGTPCLCPTYLVNDYLTAYLGTVGILSALERRARNGGSYHVKVSLARTSMWVQSLGLVEPGIQRIDYKALTPRLQAINGAFGCLEYVASPASLSRTPARFSTSSSPLGSSLAHW